MGRLSADKHPGREQGLKEEICAWPVTGLGGGDIDLHFGPVLMGFHLGNTEKRAFALRVLWGDGWKGPKCLTN